MVVATNDGTPCGLAYFQQYRGYQSESVETEYVFLAFFRIVDIIVGNETVPFVVGFGTFLRHAN